MLEGGTKEAQTLRIDDDDEVRVLQAEQETGDEAPHQGGDDEVAQAQGDEALQRHAMVLEASLDHCRRRRWRFMARSRRLECVVAVEETSEVEKTSGGYED